MGNKEYYISNGGNKIGPLSSQDIVSFLKSGRLTYFDMIYNKQINDWVMIMQHPDFADAGEEVRDAHTDASITVGLVNDGEFKALELESAADTFEGSLESLGWFLQEEPQTSYSFLEVLALVEKGRLSEQSVIGKGPRGPWKTMDKWEEFSEESIEKLKGNTEAEVPSIHLRRTQQRVPAKRYFLVFFNGALTKEFCLEISKAGLSLFCKTELFRIGDVLTLRFDSEFAEAFDAEGKVVSQRRVRVGSHNESFVRYGVSFSKLSPRGHAVIEQLMARYR